MPHHSCCVACMTNLLLFFLSTSFQGPSLPPTPYARPDDALSSSHASWHDSPETSRSAAVPQPFFGPSTEPQSFHSIRESCSSETSVTSCHEPSATFQQRWVESASCHVIIVTLCDLCWPSLYHSMLLSLNTLVSGGGRDSDGEVAPRARHEEEGGKPKSPSTPGAQPAAAQEERKEGELLAQEEKGEGQPTPSKEEREEGQPTPTQGAKGEGRLAPSLGERGERQPPLPGYGHPSLAYDAGRQAAYRYIHMHSGCA